MRYLLGDTLFCKKNEFAFCKNAAQDKARKAKDASGKGKKYS